MKHPVIGVTGLPCAGKSYAARLLASGEVTGTAGVLVQADNLGHELLVRSEVEAAVRGRFGDGVIAAGDAAETRRRIAAKVFGDPVELAWLESLLHPLIAGETDRIIADAGGRRPVVVEAALLFAAGMHGVCDQILLVEAGLATRCERASKRGWRPDELARREARLLPLFEPERLEAVKHKIIRVRNDLDDSRLGERIRAAMAVRGTKQQ